MKIFAAIVAACLAAFLFYEAYAIQGISLQRFGYIGGAVILVFVVLILFLPKQDDEQQRKF